MRPRKIFAGCLGGLAVFGLCLSHAQEKAKDTGKTSQLSTGTIIAVDKDSISVRGQQGKPQNFRMNATTVFGTKKNPKKASDFKPSDKIAITYSEDEQGHPVAQAIRPYKPKPASLPNEP